jgi:hypothetical protein
MVSLWIFGVKAAGAFGWRPTTLVVPKVEKIRGLNLPGTPRATSACRGRPLLFMPKNDKPRLSHTFLYSKLLINSLYFLNLPRSSVWVNYFFHLHWKHSVALCLAMNNAAKRHPTTQPALHIYHTHFRRHPSSHLLILSQPSLKEANFSFTFRRTSSVVVATSKLH